MDIILQADHQLFQAINSLAGRWQFLDWLGIFCAKFLIWVIFIIVAIWWLNLARTRASHNWPIEGKRKWLIFGSVSLSLVLSVLINQLLAMVKFRSRPFLNFNINKLIEPLSEKSFPSDHATVAFAISTAVFFYNKKLGSVLIFLSVLISIGRIFAGVHYPIDIIGGMIVGGGVALTINQILKTKDKKYKPKT